MSIHSSEIANFCIGDVVKVKDFNGLVVDTEVIHDRFITVTLAWRDRKGRVIERRFSEHLLLKVVEAG